MANDCGQNAFDILEHVVVPETQNTIASLDEVIVTDGIAQIFIMLATVGFDNDFCLEANEIDNVWSK